MNRVNRHLTNSRGFTLVELLIVSGLVGIVMAAVLGLVVTTQRHTRTSEEVVDVQQNLRVALDFMSRDLRHAGLGVAADAIILEAPAGLRCEDGNGDGDCLDAGESDFLRFQTLTSAGAMARIGANGGGVTTASPASGQVVELGDENSARLLARGEAPRYVRIFRPSSRSLLLDQVLEIDSVDDESDPPTVTLKGFDQAVVLRPGDLVVRVMDADLDEDGNPNTDPPQHPQRVDYRLVKSDSPDADQFDLVRVPTGVDPDDEENFERIARKVTEVRFQYLLEGGGEGAPVAGSDLERVRAVRMTLVGATDASLTGSANFNPGGGSNVKTRALSSVVELRNR